MSVTEEYRNKLITADKAAQYVKSGDRIFYGEFALFPVTIDEALAKRAQEVHEVHVSTTCLTRNPKIIDADPTREHFIFADWHLSGASRKLAGQNLCNYIPFTYHQAPRVVHKYNDYDVAFISVAPMDARGYFNYGVANSFTAAVMSKAKKIILEINSNIPHCLGGNKESIHISAVDHIVEGSNPALPQLGATTPQDVDFKIAANIMEEIHDGACLQLGIGGLPNVIGNMIAESDLKDLGIHTEMMVDSMVDLYNAGKITGARKTLDAYKMTYTFALGTSKLYEFLDNNPVCASYPVNYMNDPRLIALNNNAISINNAMEVDLFSQICSESDGTRQISGTGGQFDFHFGSFMSHGGKGIIALSSTFTDKNGKVHSRIVPTLKPGSIVTVPRSIVQYVATEFGVAQFKGKSTWERAEAMIGLAHPDFRDDLIKEATKMNIWTYTNKKDA